MHHSMPWFQMPNRVPAISHNPPIRYATLSRMNAQPPRNFAMKSSERLTGLLSKSVIEPGSNICGMMVEVTRMAAKTPAMPTTMLIVNEMTHSLRNVSARSLLIGSGPVKSSPR